MWKLVLAVLGVAALSGAVWVRVAPSDPARWHVDPRREARPSTPNFHLLRMGDGDAPAPIFDMAPQRLADAFHEVATADGATLLAGSPADGHMTYLTRSRLMGFPDYTSVLIESAGDGAMLTGFARARFGHSDMGANRARLEGWIAALEEQARLGR